MQIVESGAASSESYMLRHVRRRRHCGGQQLKLGRWLYTGFFHWRYRHRQQRHDSAILNGSHCSRCQPHSLTSASAPVPARHIAPGSWCSFGSHLSPTFWCECVSAPPTTAAAGQVSATPPPSSAYIEFIARHSDAERFREEYPACRGAQLRSKASPSRLAKADLVQIEAPKTAMFQSDVA